MENNFENYPKRPSGTGFSISALILGICGIVFLFVLGFFWGVAGIIAGIVCGILAIVFGYKGRKISLESTGTASSMATAGLVLGVISLTLSTVGTLSCAACIGCSAWATSALFNHAFYY